MKKERFVYGTGKNEAVAYAEEQKDWDEVERLKEQFRRLLERV